MPHPQRLVIKPFCSLTRKQLQHVLSNLTRLINSSVHRTKQHWMTRSHRPARKCQRATLTPSSTHWLFHQNQRKRHKSKIKQHPWTCFRRLMIARRRVWTLECWITRCSRCRQREPYLRASRCSLMALKITEATCFWLLSRARIWARPTRRPSTFNSQGLYSWSLYRDSLALHPH